MRRGTLNGIDGLGRSYLVDGMEDNVPGQRLPTPLQHHKRTPELLAGAGVTVQSPKGKNQQA